VSKGALLLGLPAGLGLIVVLWAGRIGLYVVGGGVVALLLALIPLSRLPRFASLFEFGEGSSFFRVQLWQSTLRMIRDHPLTGLGLDQFLYAYRSRYILPAAWQQPDLSQPHNVWLNYWVRLGVVGLAAGIWMQVGFWRLALRTQRMLRNNPSTRALMVGLMGSMAAFLGHGMVDAVHFVIDLSFIFFMTLGLAHQLGEEVAHGSND
jgi:O-antigen ligase